MTGVIVWMIFGPWAMMYRMIEKGCLYALKGCRGQNETSRIGTDGLCLH